MAASLDLFSRIVVTIGKGQCLMEGDGVQAKSQVSSRFGEMTYVLSDLTMHPMHNEVAKHSPTRLPFVILRFNAQLGALPTSTPTSVQNSVLVGPLTSHVILFSSKCTVR